MYAPDTPHFMAMPYGDGQTIEGYSKILNVGALVPRPHVLAWVRGTKVPFYQSTGMGGKASVVEGKWYPHFGIGPDNWLNKGSEEAINAYYGSKHLKKIAEWLDANVGDVRDHPGIPEVGTRGPHRDAINSDVSAVANGEDPIPNAKTVLLRIHNEASHPTQQQRLQDANSHALLKKHAEAHPELELGLNLP